MNDELRRHVWISNRAFTQITGIRYVCMDCGEGVASKREATKVCPGKRAQRDEPQP